MENPTNMNYTAGQFKRKLDEILIRKIYALKGINHISDSAKLQQAFNTINSMIDHKEWDADLQILPDTTEPQKGDLVEVSDDGVNWYNDEPRKFTGGISESGKYIVEVDGIITLRKHIRLAKSPEQVRHEQAEKKAREFIESKGLLPNASPIYTLTEYIKTEK